MVRTVEAGASVLLRGDSGDTRQYSVSIASKFAHDEDAASAVCRDMRWSPRRGALLAKDLHRLEGSIWIIEIRIPASKRGHRIEIWSDDRPRFSDAQSGPGNIAFGLLCESWQPDGQTQHRAEGFSEKVLLDVFIPSADLGATGLSDLRDTVFDAAAIWVEACRECRPENLAVIRYNDEVFVRPPLADWLLETKANRSAKSAVEAEKDLAARLEDKVFLSAGNEDPAVKALSRYVPLPDQSHFCSLQGTEATPIVFSIQGAVCRPGSMPQERRARIEVAVRMSGATRCGTDPEIIACRADNVLTELNGKDYRFLFQSGATPIGGGSLELEILPVFAHEMGHWIGLGHIDGGNSLMASSAERARCIDEKTIASLSSQLGQESGAAEAFRLHDAP
ncbi:hypothetical protein FHX08_005346 [Rhizobium sp. BK529]|uniref:hypothetical protein n=1 Tax=Rhizobium sp. BK529 TaxID=2586983 RepID=UPI0016149583|nr:hypothetical protein [Rhizobium sp. BK529]MBB3594936.1 hypothetical protein [Rhizobium sp. BK529]